MERAQESERDVPGPGSIVSPRTYWQKVLCAKEHRHGAESTCQGTFLTSHTNPLPLMFQAVIHRLTRWEKLFVLGSFAVKECVQYIALTDAFDIVCFLGWGKRSHVVIIQRLTQTSLPPHKKLSGEVLGHLIGKNFLNPGMFRQNQSL
jgi:hypothetical protein